MSRMTIWRGSTASPTTLDDAVLYAPLTHSLVLQRGTGSPTFTRATTETGQKWDEAGYLDFTALAGEVVFKGARRVRNALQNASIPSEDFSVAAWAASGVKTVTANYAEAPSGEMTADRVVIDTGGYLRANTNLGSSSNSKTWLGSVYIKATSGTQTFRILLTQNGVVNNYSSDLVATSEWQRFSFAVPFTAGGSGFLCGIADKVAGGGTDLVVWGYQAEDVTGQTTQTASEYVSVGVESAPAYHGSMVDGVKCYDTDRSGNPITTTTTYDAVTLNGVAGTYVSTPDSVSASITGDIDIRVKAALVDWTPAADNTLVSKNSAAGTQLSYAIVVDPTTGNLRFYGSLNGLTLSITTVSTSATGFSDGATGWVRATRVSATGVINFYTSTDGVTWTQLGTANLAGSSGALNDSTSVLKVGQFYDAGTAIASGKIYQAQIYNGINGTLAVDFDASRYAGGTTLTGSTGETWTLNGSAVIHPTNYPLVGYVPWEARMNLCLQSNAFNTTWTENGAVLTCTQNVVGPDGATSAWTFTDDSAVAIEGRAQAITLTAAAYTFSVFVKKTTGATVYPAIFALAGTTFSGATIDTNSGVCTPWVSFDALTPAAGMSANCVSHNSSYWRASLTFTGTAASWSHRILPAIATSPTQSAFVGATVATLTGSAVFYGAQVELGSFATPYIPTTTVAVARNADVDQYPTTDAPIAAAGAISLDFTPYHAPSGTIALWGTYVDASNYTAILHDATNLIFRKRIAGVNYDATIANAFTSGTTYKMAASWGVGGSTIYLNGVAGTPHANTTAAQIAATMQFGANGNSLQQPGAAVIKNYIWQRQLSGSEQAAITA